MEPTFFIESSGPDKDLFYKKYLSSQLTSRGLEVVDHRTKNSISIIFAIPSTSSSSGTDPNLAHLIKIFNSSDQNTKTVILIPSGTPEYTRKVEGWIYGCKLPKKVPSPRTISTPFQEMAGVLQSLVRR